jgi:hypothetical protein
VAEIFGVTVPDLDPELGTPVEVLCIIKCLRNENDTAGGDCTYRLVTRSSSIPTWEAYGMAAWVQQVAFDSDLYEDEEEDSAD